MNNTNMSNYYPHFTQHTRLAETRKVMNNNKETKCCNNKNKTTACACI